MKTKKIVYYILGIFLLNSCSYLDIVPDNIPTLEHAFGSRAQAEKFFFTCYSSLPSHSNPHTTPAFLSGDEMMVWPEQVSNYYPNLNTAFIARGKQGSVTPLINNWDGVGTKNLFIGIRNCNIFLEEIDKVHDLEVYERVRWKAEVKFLKAYYHFYLLRLYGPIPIIAENLPIDATPEEVRIFREPVDDVIGFICNTIDEAIPDLPSKVMLKQDELGRITKPIAMAVKAQARVWAASPLFNGNNMYSDFVDGRGVQLISQTYDPAKWDTARIALKEAIDEAELIGHQLFYWEDDMSLSNELIGQLNIREAVCEPWNDEIIWGGTDNTHTLQRYSQPRLARGQYGGGQVGNYNAPGLRMVELFYSANGIPLKEDPNYTAKEDWYKLTTAAEDHAAYIEEGYETVNIHFNREPRFYASLSFDGSRWFGNGREEDDDMWTTDYKKGGSSGFYSIENTNATGYSPKKLVSYKTAVTNHSFSPERYSFPIIRLADLYLMYAEALNESQGPTGEVYDYLDRVRTRAGLNGVQESWAVSINPGKPTTKDGLREIIHQERMIELAFEGSRFYDLRRWLKAEQYMNQPIRGWNIMAETTEDFYQIKVLEDRTFSRRDYLWPIRESNTYINNNLMQNPDW